MDLDWAKFHEWTKKYDPLGHYAVDHMWKSSTRTVNETGKAIGWDWLEKTSAKDEKDFDRWFENSVGSVAAVFGGMYAAGAYGGGAAATGGTGIGATSGATGSGMVAGASGGGTGAGLSVSSAPATSLGTTGLGVSGQTGAGIGAGGTQAAGKYDWLQRSNPNQQRQNNTPNQTYAARALRSDSGYQPGPGWVETTRNRNS